MKTSDIRNLTESELMSRLHEAEKDYASIEQAVFNGKEKNHAKLKTMRQIIARLKTIQKQSHDKQ